MIKFSPKLLKIIKTCNIYFAFLVLGLALAVAGPCLIDLQHMVSTDTQHISLIYTARSTGYLVGSGLGGILLDLSKSKQAVVAACCFITTATMLGIPWSRSVEVLAGFILVNGLSLGALENGCNVICLNLWGKHSGPVFQGLHFAFGLGGLVAPLIAAPYLSNFSSEMSYVNSTEYLNQTSLDSTSKCFSNNSITLNTSSTASSTVELIYPFYYIGAVCLLVSVMLLVICIISPTEEIWKDSDKKDNSSRSIMFMVFVVFLNFCLIFLGAGVEIGYAQMLTTFAVKGRLQLSTAVGSYVTSAFWASFTISRLATVFLAIRFKNIVLIIGDLTLAFIAALLLLFLMPNEWTLWLASVLFGLGIAPLYPTAVGWLNDHIYVTSKIASIFTIGAAAGEMVVPFIISYFIDIYPDMFTYVITAGCVSTAFVVFCTNMFFNKFDKKETAPHKPEIYVIRTSSINI